MAFLHHFRFKEQSRQTWKRELFLLTQRNRAGAGHKCLQPYFHSSKPIRGWCGQWIAQSPSGQVTTDAPSPSLMREELSQLIYHDKIFQRITLSIGGLGPVVLSVDTSPYCGWEETGLGRGQGFSTSLLLNRKLSPVPDRVTALRPGPEVIWSPHKEALYSLSPPWPWSSHPKVDPQLQQRKIILGTFCLFWEAQQSVAFIL